MRFGNCVVAGLVGCLAGSVCAADRSAAIREALGAIPETVARMPTNGVDGARLWNYTPRLERLMPLLKPIGNLPVFAFWQREHVEMTATPLFGTLTLSTEAGEGALPQPVLVDPVRGKVWDAKAYRGSDLIRGVVKFTGVFALDYPLILTDLSVFGDLCERK